MDLICSTLLISGALITACCKIGHHIVALEENKDIFDAFLKPMMRLTLAMVETQSLPIVMASQDLDEMLVVVQQFAQKEKFSKFDFFSLST